MFQLSCSYYAQRVPSLNNPEMYWWVGYTLVPQERCLNFTAGSCSQNNTAQCFYLRCVNLGKFLSPLSENSHCSLKGLVY